MNMEQKIEYLEKELKEIKINEEEYYKINKEKIKKSQSEYYKINKEKIKKLQLERYKNRSEEDKEKYKKKQLEYYKNNKEKIRIRNQKYFEKYYEEKRLEILERYRKTDNHKLTDEERRKKRNETSLKWYYEHKDYFLEKSRYYRSQSYIHNKRGMLFSKFQNPDKTNGVSYSLVEVDFEE